MWSSGRFYSGKKYVLAIIKTFSDNNNLNVLGSDNKGFFTQGLVVYFFHEGVRPSPISISHVFEKENNNSLSDCGAHGVRQWSFYLVCSPLFISHLLFVLSYADEEKNTVILAYEH